MDELHEFNEKPHEPWSLERERLMQRAIRDLGLTIEGTYLQELVARLHAELDAAGIRFKPKVYLSDEWSCPDGVPVIGIPFYLADARLMRIEDEIMDGVEAQSEQEISRYLRHEAGHAFNYAYKLYETQEWERLFGPFNLPYLEAYAPRPFSRDYVRHIPAWYAQKHPDEDFAETFAVWLTPRSNWREVYHDWGCYRKLLYVERIVKELGDRPPVVTGEDYDFATEERPYSVAEHYRKTRPELEELPAHFDRDLQQIFAGTSAQTAESAHDLLLRHRRTLVRDIAHWTGLYDVHVRSLINHLIERSKRLELCVDQASAEQALCSFVALSTALCMNKLHHGEFIAERKDG